jgi:hypothetical protein
MVRCLIKHEDNFTFQFSAQYFTVNKPNTVKFPEHLARKEKMRNEYGTLFGKSETNDPILRPSRRQEDNIKIDITGSLRG